MSFPAEPTPHSTAPTSPASSCDTDGPTAVDGAEGLLVQSLQRGEDDAFARLVRLHGAQLLATGKRMLGCEDDARDCLQETFLAAFRAIHAFEAKSRLSTWLHRILVNTVLMKLRSRRSRPECSIDELVPRFTEDGHHVDPPCPWSGQATQALHTAESGLLVRRAIDKLPPAYREVVLLRDIEGLSTEVTGQLLSVTPNAVKIRLHRARQALRTLLDRHLQDLTP